MFISGDPGLSPFLLLKGVNKDRAIKGLDNCLLFSHARGALIHYLNHLKINKNRNKVLVPDYICDDLVRVVKSVGFEVEYYNITEDIIPDKNNLREKITDKILAIIIVHYFGFLTTSDDIVSYCGQRGVCAIDDCAHVLFYDVDRVKRIFKGDAAIFSLKKQYPILDGGLLLTRDTRLTREGFGRYPATRMNLGKLFTKYILGSMTLSPARNYGEETHYDESFEGVSNISSISENILTRYIESDSIIKTRCDNFYYYVNALQKLDKTDRFEMIYSELRDFEVPYMFPVKLKNDNKSLIRSLRRQGMPVIRWPTLPDEVNKSGQHKAAKELQERIMLLPLHQDISSRHIDHIIHKFYQAI